MCISCTVNSNINVNTFHYIFHLKIGRNRDIENGSFRKNYAINSDIVFSSFRKNIVRNQDISFHSFRKIS